METPIVYYRESRFVPNEILTSRMLENIYTYPRAVVDIQYQTYPDGILTGLDFNQDATGNVFLTPGLVKYKGRIYILAQTVNLQALVDHKKRQNGWLSAESAIVYRPSPWRNDRR